VSSVAHDRTSIGGIIDGHIHFEDIHCRQRKYDAGQYHQSKLANVLHARKLAQIHGQEGIYAFSAHPGTVTSNLYRDYNFIMRMLLNVTFNLAGSLLRPISKEDGAQTSLHCLLSDEALQHNGAYFAQKCYPHRNGERGGWPLVSPNPEASDDTVAEKLWSVTKDMIAELTA
jgi:NAD(P)-dependent dehydrogenase (short-subunit alcohol dehydrogenase family)